MNVDELIISMYCRIDDEIKIATTRPPADALEQSVLPHPAGSAPANCAIPGDRNYARLNLKARLAADGRHPLTPAARQAKNDPDPDLVKGKK